MVFEDLLHRRPLIAHALCLVVEQQRRHAASAHLKLQALFIACHAALVHNARKFDRAVLSRRKAHRPPQHLRHRRLVCALERKAVARHASRVGKFPLQQRRQLKLRTVARRQIPLHHGSVTRSPTAILLGFLICGFTFKSAVSVTPYVFAMPHSVSPRLTV